MAETIQKLRLGTRGAAEKSLQRLIRELHQSPKDANTDTRYRTIFSGMRVLLEAFRDAKADELERRLEELEARIIEAGK